MYLNAGGAFHNQLEPPVNVGRAGYSTNTDRQQEIQKLARRKYAFSLSLQRRNSQEDMLGFLNVRNMYKTVFLVHHQCEDEDNRRESWRAAVVSFPAEGGPPHWVSEGRNIWPISKKGGECGRCGCTIRAGKQKCAAGGKIDSLGWAAGRSLHHVSPLILDPWSLILDLLIMILGWHIGNIGPTICANMFEFFLGAQRFYRGRVTS